MNATRSTPKQWDIWWVDQKSSRQHTNPPIPLDAHKPKRLFIVITPDAFNSGGRGCQVIALPLSSQSFMKAFEVEIKAINTGLKHDSFVKCFQPTPIHHDYLIKHEGVLQDVNAREKIKEILADFLEIG